MKCFASPTTKNSCLMSVLYIKNVEYNFSLNFKVNKCNLPYFLKLSLYLYVSQYIFFSNCEGLNGQSTDAQLGLLITVLVLSGGFSERQEVPHTEEFRETEESYSILRLDSLVPNVLSMRSFLIFVFDYSVCSTLDIADANTDSGFMLLCQFSDQGLLFPFLPLFYFIFFFSGI